MPFKTIRPPATLTAFSSYSTLAFNGPDAGAFLQAQTMNDVAGLALGRWQWNGWLTAKGRVVALFALARLGESEFLAVLPDFPAAELKPLLQRFVFRLKVRIETESAMVAAATWPATEAAIATDSPGSLLGSREYGLGLTLGAPSSSRTLWLVPPAVRVSPAESSLDDAWLRADMAMGLPRLSPAQREAWTPQMLSLERLPAFSLKKGCYPGQEIVARTHYLGQARRRLSRIVGVELAEADAVSDRLGTAIGSVIRVSGDGTEGLAVIQADFDGMAPSVHGRVVSLPPFQEVGELPAV